MRANERTDQRVAQYLHLDSCLFQTIVHRSVGPSVPCYFRTTNMAVFEDKKSSNDIINNDTMCDDEVVASYVPPRYLFCTGVYF